MGLTVRSIWYGPGNDKHTQTETVSKVPFVSYNFFKFCASSYNAKQLPGDAVMEKYAVLSAIGPDRAGLVAELTDILLQHNANIENSKMAVLGGDFAIILLFSAAEEKMRQLFNRENKIKEQTGLAIQLRETEQYSQEESPGLLWRLKAVSLDHPGIIHSISEIASRKGINIIELTSCTASAPVSGTPIFSTELRLYVPADMAPAPFRKELQQFGDKENIDIEIHIDDPAG